MDKEIEIYVLLTILKYMFWLNMLIVDAGATNLGSSSFQFEDVWDIYKAWNTI